MDALAVAFADPKDSRAISRMDGPQAGRSTLRLGVDTHRARATSRNTGPSDALTENAGGAEAIPSASANDSIGWAHSEYARPASRRVCPLNGGDVRKVRFTN